MLKARERRKTFVDYSTAVNVNSKTFLCVVTFFCSDNNGAILCTTTIQSRSRRTFQYGITFNVIRAKVKCIRVNRETVNNVKCNRTTAYGYVRYTQNFGSCTY